MHKTCTKNEDSKQIRNLKMMVINEEIFLFKSAIIMRLYVLPQD